MQFLLAQFMAKKNPKASVKALDGYISDAEACVLLRLILKLY